MKTTMITELNDREKAALEIIADIECSETICRGCPFKKRINCGDNSTTICIKNYINQIVKENV